MLRYEDVAELLRVIDNSSCEELILDNADFKIVVRRRGAGSGATLRSLDEPARSLPPGHGQVPVEPLPPGGAMASAAPTSPAPEVTTSLKEIRAPMVGTFFRAPGPGKAPFVEVGSVVQKGDQVCLIEVMKLFTSIYAQESSRIIQVCAQDAQLVEFGQLLFVLEPA